MLSDPCLGMTNTQLHLNFQSKRHMQTDRDKHPDRQTQRRKKVEKSRHQPVNRDEFIVHGQNVGVDVRNGQQVF